MLQTKQYLGETSTLMELKGWKRESLSHDEIQRQIVSCTHGSKNPLLEPQESHRTLWTMPFWGYSSSGFWSVGTSGFSDD